MTMPTAVSMSDAVLAATPKQGGRLRQGFSACSTTESLDALKSTGVVVEISNNWCWGNSLTEIMPDGSTAPELAESIESSADAKTWMFKPAKDIRKDGADTVMVSITQLCCRDLRPAPYWRWCPRCRQGGT